MTSNVAAGTPPVPLPGGAAATSDSLHQHKAPAETSHMNVLGRDGTDTEIIPQQQQQQQKNSESKKKSEKSKRPNSSTTNGNTNFAQSTSPPASPPRASLRTIQQVSSSPDQRSQSGRRQIRTSGTQPTTATAAATTQSWWDKMQVWTSKPNDEDSDNYLSLESPADNKKQKKKPGKRRAAKRVYHQLDRTDKNDPLAPNDANNDVVAAISAADNSSSSNNECNNLPVTEEDQVRNECSFFYRGLDDAAPPPTRRTVPSRSLPYDTAPRLLSSRDGAVYHAKYQRLNQEIVVGVEDDLHLTIEDQQSDNASFISDCSRNVMNVQNSSLVYEQNGRLLLRLPRDQVRLVMDNDLEAGIVSVEQWRQVGDDESPAAQPPISCIPENINKASTFTETNPPLRYVLTVPDDLYRRVVSEMSDTLTTPYCGIVKCCHESEHADIKIALFLLAIILILLFISTLEYKSE